MKVFVVEYYGGSYSDYWTAIKGIFSTVDKAKEYVIANQPGGTDDFSITETEIDEDYGNGKEIEFWLHRPEIVPGARVKVVKVTAAVGQKAKTYLNQVGTVYRRGSNIGVKFSDKGREYTYPITCLEII